MIALNAHFDGKVLVPDEPLTLAPNQQVRITVEPINPPDACSPKPDRVLGTQRGILTYFAPDWESPLPDDLWEHNRSNADEKANP